MMDERLIGEVERHAIIYNRQKTNMFNGDKSANKEMAWIQIAHTLGTNPDTCKKRWKYLRERYVQQKKVGDTPNYEHLSRPYLEKMHFLDTFIQPRKSYRNVVGLLTSPAHPAHNHTTNTNDASIPQPVSRAHQHHHHSHISSASSQHSLLDHAATILSPCNGDSGPGSYDGLSSTSRLSVSNMMQQFHNHLQHSATASPTVGNAGILAGNDSNAGNDSSLDQISNENIKLFDQFNSYVQQQNQQHPHLHDNHFDSSARAPFQHSATTTAAPSCNSIGGSSSEAAVPIGHIADTDAADDSHHITPADLIKSELCPLPNSSGGDGELSLACSMTSPTTQQDNNDNANTENNNANDIRASPMGSTVPSTSASKSATAAPFRNTGNRHRRTAKRQRLHSSSDRLQGISSAASDDCDSCDDDDDDDDNANDEDEDAHTDDGHLKMGLLRQSPSTFSSDFLYPFYQHAAAAQQQQKQKHQPSPPSSSNHHHHRCQHQPHLHPQPHRPKQDPQQQLLVRNSEQLLGELVTSELLKMDTRRRKFAQKKILEILFFDD